MGAEHELMESWKRIPQLQQQITLQGTTLAEQALWLASQVDELVDVQTNGWGEEQKEELLARLSLLSEIYAFLDFDRMIEVRERFQDLFPEHFAQYLRSMGSLSWQISWPGCFECRHFDGRCSIGTTPANVPGGKSPSEKHCRSKEERLKAA